MLVEGQESKSIPKVSAHASQTLCEGNVVQLEHQRHGEIGIIATVLDQNLQLLARTEIHAEITFLNYHLIMSE